MRTHALDVLISFAILMAVAFVLAGRELKAISRRFKAIMLGRRHSNTDMLKPAKIWMR